MARRTDYEGLRGIHQSPHGDLADALAAPGRVVVSRRTLGEISDRITEMRAVIEQGMMSTADAALNASLLQIEQAAAHGDDDIAATLRRLDELAKEAGLDG